MIFYSLSLSYSYRKSEATLPSCSKLLIFFSFSFPENMNTTLPPSFSPSFHALSTEAATTPENEFLRITVTVILVVITVLTLLGNGFVCLAFYRQPQLRKASYYPLLSLALADILCGMCAMPVYIVKKHISGGDKERITCDVFRFTYFFSMYASILGLTVVSLERFLAIKMPLRHRTWLTKRKMIAGLLLSWLDAALVSILPFVWQRNDTEEQCNYRPSREWSMMVILSNVCLPFMIMFACHVYTIYIALRLSRAKYEAKTTGTAIDAVRRNTGDGNSSERKESILVKRERDLTFTMTVVLGAFILCWAPSSIYYFLQMVCPQCYQPSFKQIEPIFNAVMKLLTFVNSCLNPLIYCWLNKHLRQAIHMSLLKKSEARKRKYMQTNGIHGKPQLSVVNDSDQAFKFQAKLDI